MSAATQQYWGKDSDPTATKVGDDFVSYKRLWALESRLNALETRVKQLEDERATRAQQTRRALAIETVAYTIECAHPSINADTANRTARSIVTFMESQT